MFNKNSLVTILAVSFVLSIASPVALFAAGPATVNLLSAGNFEILAKTGISTTGTTLVVGDIGVSPAEASYITGFGLVLPAASAFSTSASVVGKVYAPSYANPTPANMSTAVSDMESAYTDASGRTNPTATELGSGNIGGMTLAPGLYKWGTDVRIPTDVTLSGSANDIWIFQIAGNLDISAAKKVILSGGAQASNIFWQVAGQTTLETYSTFNGNILDQTAIVLNTGAVLNGRALAQSAVTLDSNSVNFPVALVSTPTIAPVSQQPACSSLYWSDNTNKTCQAQKQFCGAYMYQGLQTFNSQQSCLNTATAQQVTPSTSALTSQQQEQYNKLVSIGVNSTMALDAVKQMSVQGSVSVPAVSNISQQVKMITANFGLGGRSDGVKVLQQFLVSQNKGPAAQALSSHGLTSNFGAMTRAALAEFQSSVGISPASGNFGSITRAYLSSHY